MNSVSTTKKVVLITGDISDIISHDNERDSLFNKQLQSMTNFIVKDPFWSAFIDQIHVENGRKISLITSVIEPTITFGVIDNQMENKFKKIGVFLKKCLPMIQQNNYESLDVSYKNQVIGIKKSIN